jgi:excisionase family DNA binding protein
VDALKQEVLSSVSTAESTAANIAILKTRAPLPPDTVITYRVNDACEVSGLSRSKIYELIGEGKLRSVLVAGRRLIPADALRELLRGAA